MTVVKELPFEFSRPSEGQAKAKAAILAAFARHDGGVVVNKDSGFEISTSGGMAQHAVHLGEKHRPYRAHFAAATVIDELLQKAVLAETYSDRKDDNPLLLIHRLYAPFEFDDVLYRVKLTVHDSISKSDKWRRFYDHSLTGIDLEKITPAGSAHIVNGVTLPSSLGGRRILSIADLLRGATRDSDGQSFSEEDDDQH